MEADGRRVAITLTVNGRELERVVEPRLHLADFLRRDLGLTGTHVGCEQGVCGNCSVLLDGEAVKSCLMFAVQVDGKEVVTVEGLTPPTGLSRIQQIFHEEHALQCGFCTPGFLATATALKARQVRLTREEIREELAGVLCRCTGYDNVITAVERYLNEGDGGGDG